MDEEGFRAFLKKGGRSKSAIARCVRYVKEFETHLEENQGGKTLADATSDDLEDFVNWLEREPKASAKGHLWGLAYFFDYSSSDEMRDLAGILREQRIKRTPFPLREFRGVNPEHIEKLATVKIKNVNQMLKKGCTPQDREELAKLTGVPLDVILELVKLSDLARIPGVKGIRARLYIDAGVDTLEKLAQWEPVAFREMVVEFVERTGFDGVPTLPAEARFTIERAKKLPKIVEYS
jgi:hypothetical protein